MTTLPTALEKALERFTADKEISRDAAIASILEEWLRANHYLDEAKTDAEGDVDETVQYPEFMEDASGGAGG